MTDEKDKLNNNLKENGFEYNTHASTAIILEVADQQNPYIAEKTYLAGYDIEALMNQRSFVDTLFLLFKQELPNKQQALILEKLMIALINAGPRDEAVKASMLAGVSKTRAEHLLPIGLSVLGGENNGAQTVAKAYRFICHHYQTSANTTAKTILNAFSTELALTQADPSQINKSAAQLIELSPGFSQSYGGLDNRLSRIAEAIFSIMPNSKKFIWCQQLNQLLNHQQIGINPIGLAAAVFAELEFGERESIGLFQLLRAPGILAHGMEQTHKPITSIPMLKDENYLFNK